MSEREQVEKAADRLRDELLVTLRELERRRDSTLDVRAQLERHRAVVVGVGAGVGVAVLAAGVVLVVRARTRDRRLREDRWKGLVRAWRHPERLASRAPEPPLGMSLARKVALAFLGTLAAQVARRAASPVGQALLH